MLQEEAERQRMRLETEANQLMQESQRYWYFKACF